MIINSSLFIFSFTKIPIRNKRQQSKKHKEILIDFIKLYFAQVNLNFWVFALKLIFKNENLKIKIFIKIFFNKIFLKIKFNLTRIH